MASSAWRTTAQKMALVHRDSPNYSKESVIIQGYHIFWLSYNSRYDPHCIAAAIVVVVVTRVVVCLNREEETVV